MVAPDGEEVGVLVVLAKVEVIKEVAFDKGGVFEGGKLEVSGVGFGGGKKIIFGLLWNIAVGNDKKGDGEEPEKMGNDEGG